MRNRLPVKSCFFFGLCLWLAVSPAESASIRGRILPPGKASAVAAVQRLPATIRKITQRTYPGRIEPGTGQFEVPGLPDGRFDLVVTVSAGPAAGELPIEGVDLSVADETGQPRYDLVVLTDELTVHDFNLETEEELTPAEQARRTRQALRLDLLLQKIDRLLKVARFADRTRAIYVHGTRERAKALMELTRERRFHSGQPGETIWRIEIWPFVWAHGAWAKPNRGLQVLHRVRLRPAPYRRTARLFDPRLGGIQVRDGRDVTGLEYRIPEALDRRMGKVASE